MTFPGPKHLPSGALFSIKKTNKKAKQQQQKQYVLQLHWYKNKYNPNQIIFSF